MKRESRPWNAWRSTVNYILNWKRGLKKTKGHRSGFGRTKRRCWRGRNDSFDRWGRRSPQKKSRSPYSRIGEEDRKNTPQTIPNICENSMCSMQKKRGKPAGKKETLRSSRVRRRPKRSERKEGRSRHKLQRIIGKEDVSEAQSDHVVFKNQPPKGGNKLHGPRPATNLFSEFSRQREKRALSKGHKQGLMRK